MVRRTKHVLAVVAVALGLGMAAAPAQADVNQAFLVSHARADYLCRYQFPNTCRGLNLDTWSGPYGSAAPHWHFQWSFYGYYGSQRVKCTVYIDAYSDTYAATPYKPAYCRNG